MAVTSIVPSSEPKHRLSDVLAVAVSMVGSVISADAVAIHPAPPLLLFASVMLNV